MSGLLKAQAVAGQLVGTVFASDDWDLDDWDLEDWAYILYGFGGLLRAQAVGGRLRGYVA